MTARSERPSGLSRAIAYQAERFPLARTGLLLAAFGSASVNVSAFLGGRPLPGPGAYLAAFVLGLVLMFHLRVLDEIKDAEIDRLHRPERPVPRGLVTLGEVRAAGLAGVPLAIVAALAIDWRLLVPLAAAWAFMGLMTAHFFAPRLLHASLLVTLLTHMPVMAFVDLVLTGAEWAPHGGPAPGLWVFLALSFVNGCVLEIGRKTWSPEAERAGVESYSSAWGVGRAVAAWCLFVAAALGLLWVLAVMLATPLVGVVASAAALGAIAVGVRFALRPTPQGQALLDAAAGLWILLSYAAAGWLPLLVRGLG